MIIIIRRRIWNEKKKNQAKVGWIFLYVKWCCIDVHTYTIFTSIKKVTAEVKRTEVSEKCSQ